MTMKSLLSLLQREQELIETRGVVEREEARTRMEARERLEKLEKDLVANRMEMAEHFGLPPRVFRSPCDDSKIVEEMKKAREEQATKREIDERALKKRREIQDYPTATAQELESRRREIDKASARFGERAEAGLRDTAPLESGAIGEGRTPLNTAELPTHVDRAARTAGQGAGLALAFQAVPRAVDSVFTPGVVKVSCGCSPERAAQCQQKGQWHDPHHSDEPVKNEQCHVFVHELDLLDMTFDVIKARFASAAEAESNPGVEGVLNFLYKCEDNYDLERYQRDALYALTDVLRNKR